VAGQVILARGWFPIMNEYWGAMPNPVLDACYEKIKGADLMLLIVAYRRGCVPSVAQGGNSIDSVTAWEFDYAKKNKIPVLAMLASPKWPGDLYENADQAARDWVTKFRADIHQPAAFFGPEDEIVGVKETDQLPIFRAKVGEVLLSYLQELLAREAKAPAAAAGPDFFGRACKGVVDGTSIPFLGSGVYGEGDLSAQALSKALGADPDGDEKCLATAAEYMEMERCSGSRRGFLEELHRILQERMDKLSLSAPPPMYEMLLKARRPELIVSSTCDLWLEQYLEDKGEDYILVCHIVRSYKNENDGKILVFHGKDPEICVADKISLPKDKYIIYKPLGSPLLHDRLNADLEIDTVVITESDHVLLLRRLEHELTQIPTTFCRSLQSRPLLFAGYGLDVWHYRFVMQVFQLVQAPGESRPRPMVVRQPASSMEEMAWRKLNADVLPMLPDEFAQRVLASLSQPTPYAGKDASSHGG